MAVIFPLMTSFLNCFSLNRNPQRSHSAIAFLSEANRCDTGYPNEEMRGMNRTAAFSRSSPAAKSN